MICVRRGIIPGQSGNDNDNDNQFEQCSSCACNFRQISMKVLNLQKQIMYPARIILLMRIENV